jgi:hypothetical protein
MKMMTIMRKMTTNKYSINSGVYYELVI